MANINVTASPSEVLARMVEKLPADKRIWLNGFAEGLLRSEAALARKQQPITRKTDK